jgi:hypothetical protein
VKSFEAISGNGPVVGNIEAQTREEGNRRCVERSLVGEYHLRVGCLPIVGDVEGKQHAPLETDTLLRIGIRDAL